MINYQRGRILLSVPNSLPLHAKRMVGALIDETTPSDSPLLGVNTRGSLRAANPDGVDSRPAESAPADSGVARPDPALL